MRVDGKFVDAEGIKAGGQYVRVDFHSFSVFSCLSPPSPFPQNLHIRKKSLCHHYCVLSISRDHPHVTPADISSQALLFLLRRCHGLIYRLMAESEPISEELMPIVRFFPLLETFF